MEVPRPHPHLACYTFDLPAVTLIGRENTARQSLSFVTIQKRVAGLFYQQPFPCRSGGTRTPNPRIKSPLLYQLSYGPVDL